MGGSAIRFPFSNAVKYNLFQQKASRQRKKYGHSLSYQYHQHNKLPRMYEYPSIWSSYRSFGIVASVPLFYCINCIANSSKARTKHKEEMERKKAVADHEQIHVT